MNRLLGNYKGDIMSYKRILPKYAELVFAQQDYMDRSAREKMVAQAAVIE